MSKRDGASCWRHPSQRAAGVCADCLKERLSALSPSPSEIPQKSPHQGRSSFESRAGATGVALLADAKNNGRLSPFLSDVQLRRSKSWSHWEGSGNGVVATRNHHLNHGHHQLQGWNHRKSDAVLDDWTRQRFFSIFAKDQNHGHKNGNHQVNRVTTPFRGVEAVTRSNVVVPNGNVVVENGHTNGDARKLPRSKKPAWLQSLLQFALGKRTSKTFEDKKKGTSAITRSRIDGTMVNHQQRGADSWSRSPLRLLNHSSKKKKAIVVEDVRRKSCSEDHQRSSWSVSAPRVHHPTPAYTTAYYRDYGGLSLSSSPLPNGRWAQRGNKQHQPPPGEFNHCSSSSPYHHRAAAAAASTAAAAASPSTWNFYLTPLRTAKATSSSSKHHLRY